MRLKTDFEFRCDSHLHAIGKLLQIIFDSVNRSMTAETPPQKFKDKNKTMKIQIDLKSALLGIGIGVLAMFTTGAGTSSSPVGKYQVTGVGNGTGGWLAVMVDTQTGESWGIDFSRGAAAKGDKFWDAKNN